MSEAYSFIDGDEDWWSFDGVDGMWHCVGQADEEMADYAPGSDSTALRYEGFEMWEYVVDNYGILTNETAYAEPFACAECGTTTATTYVVTTTDGWATREGRTEVCIDCEGELT